MKSFSASKEVLYPSLVGPPVTLTSLLMISSVTKSSGTVENIFALRLTPRLIISTLENVWGFVIDKFVNSTWC